MMGPLSRRYGYSMDEVDQYARDLLQLLEDTEVPVPLMLLSLCRAITIVGTEEELDVSCLLIDELRDDEEDFNYDVEDDDDPSED